MTSTPLEPDPAHDTEPGDEPNQWGDPTAPPSPGGPTPEPAGAVGAPEPGSDPPLADPRSPGLTEDLSRGPTAPASTDDSPEDA